MAIDENDDKWFKHIRKIELNAAIKFFPENKKIKILEIPSHKFFLGVQYHPEFNSRPGFPEDAFKTFVTIASQN